MRRFALAILALIFAVPVCAAEYHGRDIDGEDYSCTAFSYGTSKFYNVQVEFDGDEAIVKFPKGGQLRVTLDDEDIDDPSSISAFDYKTSTFWDLDVSDLDD